MSLEGVPVGIPFGVEEIARTRELVERFVEGDPGVEAELIGTIRSAILKYLPRRPLWRRLKRRVTAEDVVDEVWVRLLQGHVLEKFEWRYAGSLANEIRTILDFTLTDMNRRISAEKRGGGREPLSLEPEDPDCGGGHDAPAKDATPSVHAWTAEARAFVRERLSEGQREVLEGWLQGFTATEIARRLEVSPRTARRAIEAIERLYRRYRDG